MDLKKKKEIENRSYGNYLMLVEQQVRNQFKQMQDDGGVLSDIFRESIKLINCLMF